MVTAKSVDQTEADRINSESPLFGRTRPVASLRERAELGALDPLES
jgi:hypothetical protein